MFGLGIYAEISIALVFVLFLYSRNQPPVILICGIYRENGKFYYLKFFLIYTLLVLRKKLRLLREKIRRIINRNYDPPTCAGLDKPQHLSGHKYAIDAVYFNGSSEDKTVLICATARRKNRLVNGFVFLRLPTLDNRFLVSPRLPDTCMRQTESEENEFSAEGLKLTPIEPMKSWKIFYQGKMKFENDDTKLFDVTINAVWSSLLPEFNYDTDMHPKLPAKAFAREPWSREYFENLEKYHQTHYEQFGNLTGYALIDDQKYEIFTNCVRDHTFGLQRDWKLFHRYVMHFFTLENGDRISVGVVSIPINFSSITVGFITRNGKNYPVEDCNLKLYQHGEYNIPPRDYGFMFKAGGRKYVVKVDAYAGPEFYIGEEAESRIVELLCTFEVNGIKGWGASEWQYRNINGLPPNINSN